MEPWNIALLVFFLVLPVLLSIATWGSERLTFRGRPVERDWEPQITHAPQDDH